MIDDEEFCIVCIYTPHKEQNMIDFFKRLNSWITQNTLNELEIIVCGKFNSAMGDMDWSNPTSDRSKMHLLKLKDKLSLDDAFRLKYLDKIGYTYNCFWVVFLR